MVKPNIKEAKLILDKKVLKLNIRRHLLMAILLFVLCCSLWSLYGFCTDSMKFVVNEEYGGDPMYWDTNFTSMELSSGIAISIFLIAAYFLFRKSQYWVFYCVFWFIMLSVGNYIIAMQFPIYNLQFSSAVSGTFSRSISPLLVVLCGIAYALPFLISLLAVSNIKVQAHIARIAVMIFVPLLGMLGSIMLNMVVYIIGLICVL